MEVQVDAEGATRHIPCKIDGKTGCNNTLVSEISHKKAAKLGNENKEIEFIDFEIDENGKIKHLEIEIDETISIKISDGCVEKFNIFSQNLRNLDYSESEQPTEQQSKIDHTLEQNGDQEPPNLPDIDDSEIKGSYIKRYNAMTNKDAQPYIIRKIIYNEGEISKSELKKRLQEAGYDVEIGKTHTGVNEVLRILDNNTGEIERDGRGENKTLKWVGAHKTHK